MFRFELSDAEWAIISPLLRGADGLRRPGDQRATTAGC
jgi:transposase